MSLLSFLIASSNDKSGSTAGAIVQLLILLLIPVALYFVMIRPQRRRQREQAAMQSQLGKGDEVLLTSGIYGFITGTDGDDRFWVEIDEDVQVRVARAAISGKVDTSATPDTTAGDDAKPSGSGATASGKASAGKTGKTGKTGKMAETDTTSSGTADSGQTGAQ